VLETKGQDSQQNEAKRAALAEWVRAVNGHGGFGTWHCDVSFNTADVEGIIAKYTPDKQPTGHVESLTV